jgi:large subunit ribosomal protein L14e
VTAGHNLRSTSISAPSTQGHLLDMGFKAFVQVGRAVLITTGPESGKLGVIGNPSPIPLVSPIYTDNIAFTVEIISDKSVLIDGPKDGASRQVINLSSLQILPIVLPKFPRGARTVTVTKKWAAAGVETAFAKTRIAKVLAVREKRSQLNDFDRFVVARLKARVSASFVFLMMLICSGRMKYRKLLEKLRLNGFRVSSKCNTCHFGDDEFDFL